MSEQYEATLSPESPRITPAVQWLLALNIGLLVRDRKTGEHRFIRLNVPDDLPRFVPVGERGD